MVEDEEILELVHEHRDDLEKAVKALVAAANRGGGEDNITAVAFQISTEGAPSTEDTVAMPAVTHDSEPDERTREYLEADPGGDTMVVPPGDLTSNNLSQATDESVVSPKRVRLVLIGVVLLAVAAALIVWGLVR
jgi:hypothetical protein